MRNISADAVFYGRQNAHAVAEAVMQLVNQFLNPFFREQALTAPRQISLMRRKLRQTARFADEHFCGYRLLSAPSECVSCRRSGVKRS